MKKLLALTLALVMALSFAACGDLFNTAGPTNPIAVTPSTGAAVPPASTGPTENIASALTLWVYPIGSWGDRAAVTALTSAFEAETGIAVTVEYLDGENADEQVDSALAGGTGPDLILAGAERLADKWGAGGYLADLSELLDETDRAELNAAALAACTGSSGAVYEYPLAMSVRCMAVNLTALTDAGGEKYLDLENHTWTTENFFKAAEAVHAIYDREVVAVCCTTHNDDQSVCTLITNLHGGAFTNADHTAYTWDDPKNIQALQELQACKGITFDAFREGAEEVADFYDGTLKMAFCWDAGQQCDPNGAGGPAGKTANGDDIVFMAFPSETGEPQLRGSIFGFGVVEHQDPGRLNAAKAFLRYFCDSAHTAEAVKATGCFPVRDTAEGADLSGIWADDPVMTEYAKLLPYFSGSDQLPADWTVCRNAWWIMLQKIGEGSEVESTVIQSTADINAA